MTGALADFVAGIGITDLPDPVRCKVELHCLDQIGAALAGSTRSWNAIVRQYALDQSPPGPATVVNGPSTATAEWAAFANATAGHGFEMDDYHAGALSHPGCVAVPVALAVGEAVDASGHEVLAAMAAGFETIVRIGLAVQPSMIADRGFHETCTEGVFGAAATAGRLIGLSPAVLRHALGIAGSHASGTTEYAQTGGEVKRLHAGLGAAGGIRAVDLASRGFTGPQGVLEGSRGFFQAFANTVRPDAVDEALGERWELLDCAIKPYCNCGLIHAPIDAMRALLRSENIAATDIKEIVVGCDHLSLVHVGTIGPHPKDMTGAQFSMEFSLAMTVALGGNDFPDYLAAEEAGYDLPAVRAVAERVRLELDAEADAAFPDAFFARVRMTLLDGRVLEQTAYASGSPDAPLSDEAIREKFRRNAGSVVGDERAAAIELAVARLADGAPARSVLATLRP